MTTPVTLSGGLPPVGPLSYGGVRFEELFKSKVSGRPEWDRARRIVKYIVYTIEVDGYVITENSTPNDQTWSKYRYILQQPGLALTYSQRGFGSFNVNVDKNRGLVDVCNGPKPQMLEFTPIGTNMAAHIVWRCEVCLPEVIGRPKLLGEVPSTGFQSPFSKGILGFNWATNLEFGTDGYANYTVEGELEIARIADVDDNLENYRAWTEPQIPPGFKPVKREFRCDDSKRNIRFSYSFVELPPMGLPVRCTGANGQYRVSCAKGPALVEWTAQLQATYTTVPTGPRREAYMRFMGLMRDRMGMARLAPSAGVAVADAAVDRLLRNPNFDHNSHVGASLRSLSSPFNGNLGDELSQQAARLAQAPNRNNANPIIKSFSVTEGLYEDSKTMSFECSWIFNTNFQYLMLASGLWRKMSDCAGRPGPQGRDLWVSDMASIVGYTSWYNYGFRPDGEIVVSSDGRPRGPFDRRQKGTLTGATVDDRNRITAGAGLFREGVDPDSGESPDAEVRLPGLPAPETSWLNYSIEFITELDPGIAVHKALPQNDDAVDTLATANLFGTGFSDNTKSVNTISQSTGEDILQRMSTSTYRVCLRGFGTRAGYKVPVPGLEVFGGVTVSPAKQTVMGPKIVANYSGIPVYMTAWILWYDVPVPPRSQQTAPPNLAQYINDVASPPKTITVPVSVPEPPISRAGRIVGAL